MKQSRLFLMLMPILVMASGCLTSEDPFYQKSDIVVDDRLIGTYHDSTNPPSLFIQKNIDYEGYYFLTYYPGDTQDRQCSITFYGVLFQVGTNRFLDIVPILDACDHAPGSTPSAIEILQGITIQPLHLVVKVCLGTNSLQCATVQQSGRRLAMRQAPGIWDMQHAQGGARMIPNTVQQRAFLEKCGSDTNIFSLSTFLKK